MSEEKVKGTVEEPVETPAEEPAQEETPKPDIGGELQELGRQLTAATKAVFDSPEAQELKTQLQRGLESLEKSLSKVTTQARETTVGQKVESGVSEAASTMKERRILDSLAESVATALNTVNQSLGQAVDKAQTRAEDAKTKQSIPQQIEISGVEAEAETEAEEDEE